MMNKNIGTIWHERKLYLPENVEHIETFMQEFSDVDFYLKVPYIHDRLQYIHVIAEDEIKTDIGNNLIMVENEASVVFYSSVTRRQSIFWIMKQSPDSFIIYESFYPPLGVAAKNDIQSAIDLTIAIIAKRKKSDANKKTLANWMTYKGTETAPFVVDAPFSPADLDNKTPFGMRSGNGEIVSLTSEQLEALKNGKYIAVDVEKEYVIFLKLDAFEGVDNGS